MCWKRIPLATERKNYFDLLTLAFLLELASRACQHRRPESTERRDIFIVAIVLSHDELSVRHVGECRCRGATVPELYQYKYGWFQAAHPPARLRALLPKSRRARLFEVGCQIGLPVPVCRVSISLNDVLEAHPLGYAKEKLL